VHFFPVGVMKTAVVIILIQACPGFVKNLFKFTFQVTVELIIHINLINFVVVDVQRINVVIAMQVIFFAGRNNTKPAENIVAGNLLCFIIFKRLYHGAVKRPPATFLVRHIINQRFVSFLNYVRLNLAAKIRAHEL